MKKTFLLSFLSLHHVLDFRMSVLFILEEWKVVPATGTDHSADGMNLQLRQPMPAAATAWRVSACQVGTALWSRPRVPVGHTVPVTH